jgi:predicted MPP superfamily phosphohydrolase
MRALNVVVFVLIFLSIYFLLHFFVFKRIANGLKLDSRPRLYLAFVLIIGAVLSVVAKIIVRWVEIPPLTFGGGVWLGLISIAFFLFIIEALFSWIFPSQRQRAVLVALALLFLTSLVAMVNGGKAPVVKTYKITLAKLPEELSGFTIVQLSDLHLGDIARPNWLKKVIEKTNRIKPDLIVITGDLIDASSFNTEEYCQLLEQLKATHGIIAVTGNHEFYSGIQHFLTLAEKACIKILRDEAITIADGLQIVGIDDPAVRQARTGGSDLKKAMEGVDSNKPVILLSHRPEIFKKAIEFGIDFQLSGHTHAGQIPPMDLIVYLYYKYPFGLYKENDKYIYTSCGTGVWGMPMRLFSRSEIVVFNLVKK